RHPARSQAPLEAVAASDFGGGGHQGVAPLVSVGPGVPPPFVFVLDGVVLVLVFVFVSVLVFVLVFVVGVLSVVEGVLSVVDGVEVVGVVVCCWLHSWLTR